MMETSDDQHDMSDELPAALQRYQDLVQSGRCADAAGAYWAQDLPGACPARVQSYFSLQLISVRHVDM